MQTLYGPKGEHYRGNINKTIDGIDCINWNDNKRKRGKLQFLKTEPSRLEHIGEKDGAINSCRNPTNNQDSHIYCMVNPGTGRNNNKTQVECNKDGMGKGGAGWPYIWDPNKSGGACLTDNQLCVSWDKSENWLLSLIHI